MDDVTADSKVETIIRRAEPEYALALEPKPRSKVGIPGTRQFQMFVDDHRRRARGHAERAGLTGRPLRRCHNRHRVSLPQAGAHNVETAESPVAKSPALAHPGNAPWTHQPSALPAG